ncbi:MAG: glycoside hydrolase family 3 C-terminal domain-containing protein, partial [Halanaerobium sp.]|nr:glycoside hydrolase family 3 C-terminal domain-containing protein [Halanaerobium sp.]
DEIAIIGEFARKPRYQGSGSSLVNPLQLDNAYDGFISRYGGEKIRYARGYDVRAEESDQSLIDEAVALARQVDQVILFAGLTETYESEGFDRQHLNLPPAHNRLIEEVSNANDKAIVVLANGAPVTMPWLDKVKAVLEAYLAGQAGGSAVWDVLSGDINPSGKLAETFPLTNSDCPAAEYFPMGPTGVEYRESIYVGYRYYDTAGQVVLFPFGHGLSYTDFAYSDLNLSKKEVRDDETLEVRVRVRNTGDRFGKEVVQLYIRDKESSVFRPNKELKGFIKVALQPGEEKEAGFVLDRRSFAYYDTRLKAWHVESGDFEILIGASAADIRLTETVHVESTVKVLDKADNSKVGEAEQQGHVEPAARIDGANKGKPMDGKLAVYYNVNVDWQITREQFAQLYGREIVHPPLRRKGEYDINTTIGEIRSTFLGRQLYKIVMREVGKAEEMDEKTRAMYAAMVKELPLRNLIMGSGGWISREILEAIIMMLNGRYLKGAGRLYKIISGKSSAAGKTR